MFGMVLLAEDICDGVILLAVHVSNGFPSKLLGMSTRAWSQLSSAVMGKAKNFKTTHLNVCSNKNECTHICKIGRVINYVFVKFFQFYPLRFGWCSGIVNAEIS